MRERVSTLILAFLMSSFAWGDPLPAPAGRVVLSLSGQIDRTNVEGRADFDMSMLEAYPQHQLDMETPWTEGVQHFEGVLLFDLLNAVGAHGTAMRAVALNDYHAQLNLDELSGTPVLIAIKHNGDYMRVRDKGPLWIVYPFGTFPASEQQRHQSNMVWQLRALELQ